MSMAESWAWEALLASDSTRIATVAPSLDDLSSLAGQQPVLRARLDLFLLREVAYGRGALGSHTVAQLVDLAEVVAKHNSGQATLDQYTTEFFQLDPKVDLIVAVGFVLVLKKLQGLTFPGSQDTDSPGEAFELYCSRWKDAGISGRNIKDTFDRLLDTYAAARPEDVHGLTREADSIASVIESTMLKDLRELVEEASDRLGPAFLQEVAKYADDFRGHNIREQLDQLEKEPPRKQQRLEANEAGPGSPEAYARAIAAYAQRMGIGPSPARANHGQIMDDASAQRLNARVRAREAFAEDGMYAQQSPAVAGGMVIGTPARARVSEPDAGGAGPSQPRQGRTMVWGDTPGEVPDPLELSPTRRAYRPPSYRTPQGPGEPKGRRPTVRWTQEETDHLTRMVHEFGMGSWAAMINSLQHDDLIQRRSAVDLKDKWRNMCKARPELERVGRRDGDQPGPHGTPAALRRPPAEQVDEHPPRDAGAASDTALHSGNGAPAAAEAGGTAAIAAAAAGGDGSGNGEPAEARTVEGGMVEGGTAEADSGEGTAVADTAELAGEQAAAG